MTPIQSPSMTSWAISPGTRSGWPSGWRIASSASRTVASSTRGMIGHAERVSNGARPPVVVGVDGCPAGWIAIRLDLAAGGWRADVHRTFAELLDANRDAAAIGVDIPIGLAETGARACDRAARARLGARRSSVFTPPTRRLLALIGPAPYRDANAI